MPSLQSPSKAFSISQPFTQFRFHQGTNEWGSLVRTDTVLISSCFSEVWTEITVLTIADSLSLRLKKWCIASSTLWGRCLRSEWKNSQSTLSYTLNLLLLLPYPTNTITRLMFLWKPVLKNSNYYPKMSILVYYSSPPPPICLEILPSCHKI